MGRSSRTLIGGTVALLAAVLLVVLLIVRSGGSHGTRHVARETASRPAPSRASKPRSAPRSARPHQHVRSTKHPAVRAHAKVVHHRHLKLGPPPPLPLSNARTTPWQDDGTSYVADSKRAWLAVYATPHKQRPSLFLRSPDRIGSPRTLLVHTQKKNWVRVYLPHRPNGLTGWVQRKAVRVLRNPYRLEIGLSAHRLTLWKGNDRVLETKTVVGKSSTPTPVGMFFIVDLLRPPDPNGAYGPYAFNLSAHSRVFFHFAGGDGVVAIHGTNEPSLLGQSASHGCIRVRNAVIRRLAHVLPLGTPVLIRA